MVAKGLDTKHKNFKMLKITNQKNKNISWNLQNINNRTKEIIVFSYSNQVLTAVNINSDKQIQNQDVISIGISSQVSSKNKIIDAIQLGGTIADIAEVFKNKRQSSGKETEIPCIFFIESDKFHITEYNREKIHLIGDINLKQSNKLDYLSPYVPSDSYCEILDLNPEVDIKNKAQKSNLVFSSKSYLKGWADTIRISELSAAYIGPIISPILYRQARVKDLQNIYVVLEKLSARIYHIESFTAYQYSLPFGTAQLCNDSNQEENLKSLSNQVTNVLKTHNYESLMERKNIIPIGWPATKSQSDRLFKRNLNKVKILNLEDTTNDLYTNVESNNKEYLLVKDLCFAAKACMEILK